MKTQARGKAEIRKAENRNGREKTEMLKSGF
jgi:hypothetical protein